MILKSRSELQSQQSKTMDSIDIDNLIEVPDTPDRLITAAHNSDRNRIVNKDYNNGRMKSQHTEKVKPVTINGNPRLFIHPNSRNISPISQSFKSSRPTTDTTRHDKGKSLCNSNILRSTRHEQSGINRINASRKGVLPLNSFPAIESKSCKLNSTVKTGPSVDRGKGVDFIPESNASVSMQPCTSSKVPQKRMLVRNGCISPHNIMKSKSVAEKHEISSVVKEQQSGSGALACSGSNMVDIKDLIAEAKDSRRCKKEGASVHPSSESVDNSSGSNVNRCSAETERWRTPHNHRKQREIGQPNNRIMQINHRNTEHRDDGIHKEGINRHKEDSASRNPGKRSMSYVADSAGEPSTSRSKRNKNLSDASTANSVSEPNNNNNNNYNNNNNNNNDNNNNDNEGSSVRALQIEADEILARELQEQLYGEELTPAVADNMDIPLAFAMPAHQGDSSRSGGSRRRGPPTLNTRAQVQPTTSRRRLSQPRTSSRMSQLRNHFLPNHRQVSSTRNRRNSIFPPNINLDLRMEILETLEAAGDRRLPSDLFQVGREFTEDDYEMLLALDENNHQHGGATRAQINNLPESIVQVENSQECAICLENPSVGETIRHLPCLHRFHKACIDQWLRRKTSCPVCKSSVT